MAKNRADSLLGDPTTPTEIPTAIMDGGPFMDEGMTSDDSMTSVEDKTLDVTPTGDDETPELKKFRRPTRSEIMDAVDNVNTESLDVSELQQAQAAQQDTDDAEPQEDV